MAFESIVLSVSLLIALSVPGYLLRRFDKFDHKSARVLVILLIYVAQPAMVANSFLSLEFSPRLGLAMLTVTGGFAGVMLVVLGVACLVFRHKKRANDPDAPVDPDAVQHTEKTNLYRYAAMFGNTGFMGLPMVAVLFPDDPVMLLYVSLCVIVFNILTWTLGVWVITGDRQYVSLRRAVLSPVPLTAIITVPFFFVNALVVPSEVVNFFGTFGAMTTPISMVIMGARMAEIPFRQIFSDAHVYVISVLRLVLAPAVAVAILKLLAITDPKIFNALVLVSMMPTAATTIILAERFLTDSYTAIKAVLLSSLLCIVTIPLICSLLMI